jgi:hypothetical protein
MCAEGVHPKPSPLRIELVQGRRIVELVPRTKNEMEGKESDNYESLVLTKVVFNLSCLLKLADPDRRTFF